MLTLHTTGDPVAPVAQEQLYAARVGAARRADLLRQLFVAQDGHGAFSAAEEITAIAALLARVRTGHWGPLAPPILNQQARTLGPALNARADGRTAAPRFTLYRPPPYARLLGARAPAQR